MSKCNRAQRFIDLIDSAALEQGKLVSEVWLTPPDWMEMLKLGGTELVIDEENSSFYLKYNEGMKLHLISDDSEVHWTYFDVFSE